MLKDASKTYYSRRTYIKVETNRPSRHRQDEHNMLQNMQRWRERDADGREGGRETERGRW
jgi:hypothetical protein